DSEMIMEIMNGAPANWTSILTPHLCASVLQFQASIKFHEDSLMRENRGFYRRYQAHVSAVDANERRERPAYQKKRSSFPSSRRQVRAHLIGQSSNLPKPQFPRDDSNVSSGRTPEALGARPCKYCGSAKHWDNDCRHARKGEKRLRVNKISVDEEDIAAQDAYDDLYY
ncbi:hypothetical protein SISSUDRAFT_970776, partial [Sistotremastrum suecicum HHB10207 ss-3]